MVHMNSSWIGKSIVSIDQFTMDDIGDIMDLTENMRNIVVRRGACDLLKGQILANLFYEPSTRTASSFMAAMQRLGGTVIPINEVQYSSVAKGETLVDTVRTLGLYSDCIALRHHNVGSAAIAATACSKPIINAGDGIGEHPTQALLDFFTIVQKFGHNISGLTVTMLGDLLHGRTVHSLVKLLTMYGVKFNFVSPASLALPQHMCDELSGRRVKYSTHTSLDDVLRQSDVIYVTRVQKERFTDEAAYEAVKDSYCITSKTMSLVKNKMLLMHPFPRVNEISPEIDDDPRAAYWSQIENGMYVRMALLAMVLGRV